MIGIVLWGWVPRSLLVPVLPLRLASLLRGVRGVGLLASRCLLLLPLFLFLLLVLLLLLLFLPVLLLPLFRFRLRVLVRVFVPLSPLLPRGWSLRFLVPHVCRLMCFQRTPLGLFHRTLWKIVGL